VKTAFLLTLLPLLSNYYDPGAGLIIVVKDVTGEDFLGFHFSATPAGQALPQTFIWTGYFTSGVVVSPQKADAYVLSHEVAEWMNDPYLTNVVPVWNAPAVRRASTTCWRPATRSSSCRTRASRSW
jgi:hypothetical protein